MEIINAPKKRLTRSRNKIIAGVLAGFAEYFNIDPTLLRVIYVVVSILSAGFPGLLIYLICWVLIPQQY
ncbi:PspC domain-containing protein [uncultured Sunxiuqinia sp.]|uniref:PspC domain-containing protein n=1 Tax=Sunxiuqinia rutila TaxID=1397841 RepID=UPI00261C8B7D|nr:PspC domain-containing protein [uncultured Sunxiuqinia sp.]